MVGEASDDFNSHAIHRTVEFLAESPSFFEVRVSQGTGISESACVRFERFKFGSILKWKVKFVIVPDSEHSHVVTKVTKRARRRGELLETRAL